MDKNNQEFCPGCNYMKFKNEICTKCGYPENKIIPISEKQAKYLICFGCNHFDNNLDRCNDDDLFNKDACNYLNRKFKLLKEKGYIIT
jgi:hypothetical protein